MWPSGKYLSIGALVEVISSGSLGLILSQDEVYGFMWNVLINLKQLSVHSSNIRRV